MTAAAIGAGRVLIVDDEAPIRRLLKLNLEAHGYQTSEAATGWEGLVMAGQSPHDAILLDLGLPDMDGVEVLRRLREWSRTPVLVVSVRDQEDDKVLALDLGADDFLTKPFGMGELQARLRAALRRRPGQPESPHFRSGPLEMDLNRRTALRRGEPLKLTKTEYALLRLLVHHAGKVLTHRQILREVWGEGSAQHTHYLRVYVAQLRRKIEDDPNHPTLILTEAGIGYRLVELEEGGAT